jgi:Bacterial regulatory protein, Fis family
VIDATERRMIEDALKKYRWNKQKAAQELSLRRQGLAKKLKRLAIYGLTRNLGEFRLITVEQNKPAETLGQRLT